MRLNYVDPEAYISAENSAIVERVKERRAPGPLIPLDLTLLHSPPVANGWNYFLGAIRTQTTLPTDIRELAICRVAVLNEAWFEWEQHAPLAIEGGVSEDSMRELKEGLGSGDNFGSGLSPKQLAVVKYTDAMTREIKVPQVVFDELKNHFSEREVVEITATVAGMSSVLFDALIIANLCRSI
jgi:alkylhydroperoxidase family enzyme